MIVNVKSCHPLKKTKKNKDGLQKYSQLEAVFFLRKEKFHNTVGGGGGGVRTNAYFRAKLKVSVFENGQFREHLIFDKKCFFRRKKIVHPNKQELCFLEKKIFSFFFEKKCFFWKCFFEKIKKNF